QPSAVIPDRTMHGIGRVKGRVRILQGCGNLCHKAVPPNRVGILAFRLEEMLGFGCAAVAERDCGSRITELFPLDAKLFGMVEQDPQPVHSVGPLEQEGELAHSPYLGARGGPCSGNPTWECNLDQPDSALAARHLADCGARSVVKLDRSLFISSEIGEK